jgi:hypothetical protein
VAQERLAPSRGNLQGARPILDKVVDLGILGTRILEIMQAPSANEPHVRVT